MLHCIVLPTQLVNITGSGGGGIIGGGWGKTGTIPGDIPPQLLIVIVTFAGAPIGGQSGGQSHAL